MANKEKIDYLLLDIRELETLVAGMRDAEVYPVSFFGQTFDLILLIYITRTLLNDYGIITFSCNRGIRMFLMRNLRYGPWLSIIMLLLVI